MVSRDPDSWDSTSDNVEISVAVLTQSSPHLITVNDNTVKRRNNKYSLRIEKGAWDRKQRKGVGNYA